MLSNEGRQAALLGLALLHQLLELTLLVEDSKLLRSRPDQCQLIEYSDQVREALIRVEGKLKLNIFFLEINKHVRKF